MVSLSKGEVALSLNIPEELVPKFKILCMLSRKTKQEAVIDWMKNPEGFGSSKAYRNEKGNVHTPIAVPKVLREQFRAACNAQNRSMTGEIVAMMQRKVDDFEMIYPRLLDSGGWV